MAIRVTITDVARACGVTAATVSRVLNRRSDFSASEALRKRIFETAENLGYVPDLSARNLNRRTSHIIGIFASPLTHLGAGINDSLLDGLGETFHAGGYDVFLEIAAASRRGRGVPSWRFDGAILLQQPNLETIEELDRRRVPYVCVNETMGKPMAQVLSDDISGMNKAMDHLLGLGHRTIGFANVRPNYFPHYSVSERFDTLRRRLVAADGTMAVGSELPFIDGPAFLRNTVVNEGTTAVITYDHHIAVQIVGAAGQMGLRIPNDFSLIAFNDLFPLADLTVPVTAVAVRGREIGRIGAERLLARLDGRPDGDSVVRVDEDLIVRASTAAPRRKA